MRMLWRIALLIVAAACLYDLARLIGEGWWIGDRVLLCLALLFACALLYIGSIRGEVVRFCDDERKKLRETVEKIQDELAVMRGRTPREVAETQAKSADGIYGPDPDELDYQPTDEDKEEDPDDRQSV